MKHKKIIKIICLSIFIMLLIIFLYWQNNAIIINNMEYINNKLPISFNGYKILQISDLHNKSFGKNQNTLIDYTKKTSPDIIVITGDFIDKYYTDISVSMEYIKKAKDIAPIYYVSGNHESSSGRYLELIDLLKSYGVHILDDSNIVITKGVEQINLIGLKDISFMSEDNINKKIEDKINSLKAQNAFNVLLSHRPEKFDQYVNTNVDLVFTGHAHGGQVRLPLVGGLVAPEQGVFPKYTSGIYLKDSTSMVVSRGLGNSLFPFRVFNRPEMVLITLKK